ncbi:MAG: hypothetical protein WBA57_19590 [Elainellaceae cyanobacterium]
MSLIRRYPPAYTWQNRQRLYRLPSGLLVPAVTTILRKTRSQEAQVSLQQWRQRVGEQEADHISQEAIARGNALHQRLSRYLMCKKMRPCSPKLTPWRDSLIPLMQTIKNTQLVEGMVFHELLLYAGTVDAIVNIEGRGVTLCDWKTANRARRESWLLDYKLQVVAFWKAIQETYDIQLDYVLIAIALPDQEAQQVWLNPDELEELWSVWLDRLKQWQDLSCANESRR